jgi:large subunit ribosomal protein L4
LGESRKIQHKNGNFIHPGSLNEEQFEELRILIPNTCRIKNCHNCFGFGPGFPGSGTGREVEGGICRFHKKYPHYQDRSYLQDGPPPKKSLEIEKVEIFNQNGQVVSSLTLSPLIANTPFSPRQVSLVYRSYQANQHQATKKVKNRGEVTGSTRKIYRQKGTGGARHGSRYAPQFRGGGVAFGPTGQKGTPLKINHKFKKKVLGSLVGEKFRQVQVKVIEKIELASPKTKLASKLLETLTPQKKNILLVLAPQEKNDQKITRSFRNLPSIAKISDSQNLNLGEVINANYLIFTTEALTELGKRLG